ncbi:unnamed protein product [Linum trigynum]|uniref:Uncharacterized protein n=1 Tax=Linum trigynum TaxID=586398 RepID=A0AAV2CGL5_9ROSI
MGSYCCRTSTTTSSSSSPSLQTVITNSHLPLSRLVYGILRQPCLVYRLLQQPPRPDTITSVSDKMSEIEILAHELAVEVLKEQIKELSTEKEHIESTLNRVTMDLSLLQIGSIKEELRLSELFH